MPITFVGGIHGSGKTTLCQDLAKSVGAQHLIASDLIREGRVMAHGKQVADVDGNQVALLAALALHADAASDVILDGHFALLTPSGIRAISVDVFRAIGPSAIIVITIDPAIAACRLADRDGQQYAPDLLRDLQKQELNQAEHVARNLGVPLFHGPNFVTADLAAIALAAHGRGPKS